MTRQANTGFTIWLTGLPAAGKTTLATNLAARLSSGGAALTVLDGDRLRQGVSRDLGYDAASRTEQARRTAQLAASAASKGEIAIVALVSPYASDRRAARALHVGKQLAFVEVHVATPLAECERRDPKGLYAKGRRGKVTQVTGLDGPYEPPANPDLVVGRRQETPEEMVDAALELLAIRRLISSPPDHS